MPARTSKARGASVQAIDATPARRDHQTHWLISTQAADALKTLNPDQIQQMLKEVEDMSPAERERLKGMGINPDMLKMSMKVMKANPNVIKMAQEQMAKMSPEQMKQASDLAQKQMEAMAPEDLEKMADSAIAGAGGPQVVDVDVEEDAPARNARDEALVDALFVVAAAMSSPWGNQPGNRRVDGVGRTITISAQVEAAGRRDARGFQAATTHRVAARAEIDPPRRRAVATDLIIAQVLAGRAARRPL